MRTRYSRTLGRVGNREEALEFYDYASSWYSAIPDGWRDIAQSASCSRAALLSPTGVVYKLDRDGGEYDNSIKYRAAFRGSPFYVPNCTSYHMMDEDYIIAMDYMPGIPTESPCYNLYGDKSYVECKGVCIHFLKDYLETHYGYWDGHPWNVLTLVPGQYAIVDME